MPALMLQYVGDIQAKADVGEIQNIADFKQHLDEYYLEELYCLPPAEREGCLRPSPPTTERAWRLSRLLRHLLKGTGLWPPKALVATPEGGVAFCFDHGEKHADFQCFREGFVTASMWDTHGNVGIVDVAKSFDSLSYIEVFNVISRIKKFFSSSAALLPQHPVR